MPRSVARSKRSKRVPLTVSLPVDVRAAARAAAASERSTTSRWVEMVVVDALAARGVLLDDSKPKGRKKT